MWPMRRARAARCLPSCPIRCGRCPASTDAAVIRPWTMFMHCGNAHMLQRNYATMARLEDFLVNVSLGLIRCGINYRDWPGFGVSLSIKANTPRDLIGTTLLSHDADLQARIALVLGRSRDAAKYRRLFAEAHNALGERYLKRGKPPYETLQPSQVRQMLDGADAISRDNLKVVGYGAVSSDVFNTDDFAPAQMAYVLALHFDELPEKLWPLLFRNSSPTSNAGICTFPQVSSARHICHSCSARTAGSPSPTPCWPRRSGPNGYMP